MLMPLKFSAMNLLPKLQVDMSNGLLDISTWIRLSTWSSPTYFWSIPYLLYDDCILIDFVAKYWGCPEFLSFPPVPLHPWANYDISDCKIYWFFHFLLQQNSLKELPILTSIISCIHFCETWVFTIVLKLLSSKSPMISMVNPQSSYW